MHAGKICFLSIPACMLLTLSRQDFSTTAYRICLAVKPWAASLAGEEACHQQARGLR